MCIKSVLFFQINSGRQGNQKLHYCINNISDKVWNRGNYINLDYKIIFKYMIIFYWFYRVLLLFLEHILSNG